MFNANSFSILFEEALVYGVGIVAESFRVFWAEVFTAAFTCEFPMGVFIFDVNDT